MKQRSELYGHCWKAPAKLGAVHSLLDVMVDDDEEELTEEDRRSLQASREYFQS